MYKKWSGCRRAPQSLAMEVSRGTSTPCTNTKGSRCGWCCCCCCSGCITPSSVVTSEGSVMPLSASAKTVSIGSRSPVPGSPCLSRKGVPMSAIASPLSSVSLEFFGSRAWLPAVGFLQVTLGQHQQRQSLSVKASPTVKSTTRGKVGKREFQVCLLKTFFDMFLSPFAVFYYISLNTKKELFWGLLSQPSIYT